MSGFRRDKITMLKYNAIEEQADQAPHYLMGGECDSPPGRKTP